MAAPRVLFDHGPLPGGTQFANPARLIRADHPEDVPAALDALQTAHGDGLWLAGYASYELGYLFSPKLRDLLPDRRDVPLLLFGAFDGPKPVSPPDDAGPATLSRPEPVWDAATYAAAFDPLKAHIAAGDVYQANLTFAMTARYTGGIDALYAALQAKQPVPHGVLVDLGGPAILSRSPELFFSCSPAGRLVTRPMKGTAPRSDDPARDAQTRDWLQGSEKNRAENLMIVDLLRNDLSRVSQIGSVKVPQLFEIEDYATVFQMTSTIQSQLVSGTTLGDLFAALFPCGSVTGAPKISAMTILRRLEAAARDVYCGSIGWIAPDGAMAFNVAIRTLTCFDDGRARLNVGGGIVHDSVCADEYAEALLKSRFAHL
ncbi:MAG: aminodeoxychorismate synthase component I [Marinibacterium sp.]|nr:aminodeoxychorismate synthase component I [Marinibacterium sp.]